MNDRTEDSVQGRDDAENKQDVRYMTQFNATAVPSCRVLDKAGYFAQIAGLTEPERSKMREIFAEDYRPLTEEEKAEDARRFLQKEG